MLKDERLNLRYPKIKKQRLQKIADKEHKGKLSSVIEDFLDEGLEAYPLEYEELE